VLLGSQKDSHLVVVRRGLPRANLSTTVIEQKHYSSELLADNEVDNRKVVGFLLQVQSGKLPKRANTIDNVMSKYCLWHQLAQAVLDPSLTIYLFSLAKIVNTLAFRHFTLDLHVDQLCFELLILLFLYLVLQIFISGLYDFWNTLGLSACSLLVALEIAVYLWRSELR